MYPLSMLPVPGKSSIDAFKDKFVALVEDHLTTDENMVGIPDDLKAWVRELCMYNVPHGKLNRGVTVVQVSTCAYMCERTDAPHEEA